MQVATADFTAPSWSRYGYLSTARAPLWRKNAEVRTGFEPAYNGFANRCLTTWLPHRSNENGPAFSSILDRLSTIHETPRRDLAAGGFPGRFRGAAEPPRARIPAGCAGTGSGRLGAGPRGKRPRRWATRTASGLGANRSRAASGLFANLSRAASGLFANHLAGRAASTLTTLPRRAAPSVTLHRGTIAAEFVDREPFQACRAMTQLGLPIALSTPQQKAPCVTAHVK